MLVHWERRPKGKQGSLKLHGDWAGWIYGSNTGEAKGRQNNKNIKLGSPMQQRN